MPTNKSKQSIIEGFFDKVFATVAKKAHNKAIQNLAKKDPEFAKNYKTLQKLRDKIEKDMKKSVKDDKKKGKESGAAILKRLRAKVEQKDINEVSDDIKSKYQKLLKKPLKYKDKDGNDKEITVGTAKRNKNHPAHKKAVAITKSFLSTLKRKESEKEKEKQSKKAKSKAATKKAKAEKEKERSKERARQDKATKDSLKDLGKDVDPITQFFTRPK